jgi:hypothetical protein
VINQNSGYQMANAIYAEKKSIVLNLAGLAKAEGSMK